MPGASGGTDFTDFHHVYSFPLKRALSRMSGPAPSGVPQPQVNWFTHGSGMMLCSCDSVYTDQLHIPSEVFGRVRAVGFGRGLL